MAVGAGDEARRLTRVPADGLHVLLDVHETCPALLKASIIVTDGARASTEPLEKNTLLASILPITFADHEKTDPAR
jgi:hypothetical protein